MMKLRPAPLALIVLALNGCQGMAPPTARQSTASETARLDLSSETPALSFAYTASAEAAAIPALRRQLEAEAARLKTEATSEAQADEAQARTNGYPFRRHTLEKRWQTAATTPSLLALMAMLSVYTGGAHPNSGYQALVWDRAAGRRLEFADLFDDGAAVLTALTPAYCRRLDEQRREKRGGALQEGMFTDCPALGEQTLVPVAGVPGGALDHVRVILDPYVAGPYAEGAYELSLPLDASLVARVKPAYRLHFAPAS